MKNEFCIVLLVLVSLNTYAQITFEKGYYIDNAGQTINCYIKNLEWENNPSEFEFKLFEDSEKATASIGTVREFGIENVSKYIRAKVEIDRTLNNHSNLSLNKEPINHEEELFLKVLLEGRANLYFYGDGSLSRYFYKKDGSIEQLVYKQYLNTDNKIVKNNAYKKQLWNELTCSSISIEMVDRLYYRKKELLGFFVKYNECLNHEFTNFDDMQKRDLFNLSLRPGINFSQFSVPGFSTIEKVEFDSEITFRFGLEAEFVLPFKKNKWAILLEPTYQYYKTQTVTDRGTMKIDYSSIELPFGVRHYFFLNDQSKIFINAALIYDINLNSNLELNYIDLEIKSSYNWAIGAGYNLNNTYSIECRFQTPRDLTNLSNIVSEYKTFAVILGYNFF